MLLRWHSSDIQIEFGWSLFTWTSPEHHLNTIWTPSEHYLNLNKSYKQNLNIIWTFGEIHLNSIWTSIEHHLNIPWTLPKHHLNHIQTTPEYGLINMVVIHGVLSMWFYYFYQLLQNNESSSWEFYKQSHNQVDIPYKKYLGLSQKYSLSLILVYDNYAIRYLQSPCSYR